MTVWRVSSLIERINRKRCTSRTPRRESPDELNFNGFSDDLFANVLGTFKSLKKTNRILQMRIVDIFWTLDGDRQKISRAMVYRLVEWTSMPISTY